MNLAELKFGGKAFRIAESEFAGSFNDDVGGKLIAFLYLEYVRDGEPKVETWLRKKLASLFLYVDRMPQWIEAIPMWPFMEGKPMVFITQIGIGESDVIGKHLSSNTVLYLFGGRIVVSDGWEMRYRVIQQHRDLASIQKGKK